MSKDFKAIRHYMKFRKGLSFRPSYSFKQFRNLPQLIVCLSYSQLYDDYTQVDPKSFLSNIPTFDLLLKILGYENQIHYRLHDPEFDHKIIEQLCCVLDESERVRLYRSIRKHPNLTFINAEGTLRFVRLALSCFTPQRKDFKFDKSHIKNIFKAYLYCNQLWTDECVKINRTTYPKVNQTASSALIDISLKLDIPYSEFKFFKDFRTQLYKAIKLFEFAEKSEFFTPLLDAFYKERNVSNWKDYIRIHFGFFETSLKSPAINVKGAPDAVIKFMQPYLVNQSQLPLEDSLKGRIPTLLRNQFLLQSTLDPDVILVLSSDLLVDKIYQGLKFDFASLAKTYGIKDSKGLEITQKRVNSELGNKFSEEKILYSVMDMLFSDRSDLIRKSGSETKMCFDKDGKSEPDYYLRKGQNLMLFENKDVLFPDDAKFSGQLLMLKESISSKVASYKKVKNEKGKIKRQKEGLGQIYYNIIRMKDRPDLYRKFDSDCNMVKNIYPVLITYDKAYSAIGVNEYINKKIPELKKKILGFFKKEKGHSVGIGDYNIQKSVIIDIDTLIMYALLLKKQQLDLFDLIDEYFSKSAPGEPNLSSFYAFMMDYHSLGAQGEEFIKLLYGDILE